MTFEIWTLLFGALLIAMVLTGTLLQRLPLSAAMIYLGVGFCLGPGAAGILTPDPAAHAPLVERLAEAAVLISLFSVGLKLSLPLSHRDWWLPVRLAFASMMVTVALVAAVAVVALGLPLGAAILLGAILAPTDPVLASAVQVRS
ncbi:MAG: cation:proton antiporter, partial [Bdellovibrio bacteriovorus]